MRLSWVLRARGLEPPRSYPLEPESIGTDSQVTQPQGVSESDTRRGAQRGAQEAAKPTPPTPADPDLEAVAAAWPRLPMAIKAAIGALVKAAGGA